MLSTFNLIRIFLIFFILFNLLFDFFTIFNIFKFYCAIICLYFTKDHFIASKFLKY
jgi:hypothetical protein